MDNATSWKHMEQQAPLPGLGDDAVIPADRGYWVDALLRALETRSPRALGIAEMALRVCPGDAALLLLGALAALMADAPDRAMAFLKRFERRFDTDKAVKLLTALTLARQGHMARAWSTLEQNGLVDMREAAAWFIGGRAMADWLNDRLRDLRAAHVRQIKAAQLAERKAAKPPPALPKPPSSRRPQVSPHPAETVTAFIPDLPRLELALDMRFELEDLDRIQLSGATPDPVWFSLRAELTQLGLVEGFDELLCLPTLNGVEAHWYQVETVRKVLKHYRGRVLLADEVGLGKTVEAGMVLKEYRLRGMAERMLILVPASLVGQWRDEMAEKFGIDCATTQDALLRRAPEEFWAQPRVIASIAVARRREHVDLLARRDYDVVVVDEAHHLRDQASASYRLVNGLQKRFLLLLSATPVQNSLLELYNLLTLLQPGIFRTKKEFRATYMTPGKPREPANRDRLRDLMRGVMVRNTRALTALRLPRRRAATVRAVPDATEAACYQELTSLVRTVAASPQARLAVQHLLSAAGSSPAAAAAAVARFAERHSGQAGWIEPSQRYRAVGAGAKQAALLTLLARNPSEKKLVFVHHRDSMLHLARAATCNSVTRSSTSISLGTPWRSSSASTGSTGSTGSGRRARYSCSIW
jgi:SNF2-related domain